MSKDIKLELLNAMNQEAELGGGEKRMESQHAKGKLSARERINLLIDDLFYACIPILIHACDDTPYLYL